ncbi:MAG: glutamyl-tRNA reductase [Rhodothermales bacterium]
MTFYAFGVNYLRALVEVREAFSLDEGDKRILYKKVLLREGAELILLSTCNRTEAYLYGGRADVEEVKKSLASAARRAWPEETSFFLQDEAAVRHVLEVAAGLKSLVIGDAQIFSQLKDAYRIAVDEQRVGTTMHRLMHAAFRTAKRIINETNLTTGASSIPYVAVEAAIHHYKSSSTSPVDEMRVLVAGTGSMARLAVGALHSFGIRHISVTGRSEWRGSDPGIEVKPWESRHGLCVEHDAVIVATSARSPVIRASAITPTGSSTLIIDVSVPRNVEDAVGDLPGFSVMGLDDLNNFAARTLDLRRLAIPEAQRIVADVLSEFVSWVFHHQSLQPAIQAIADTFEAIRSQEVERHHDRFAGTDKEEIDRLTRSIIQKILAVPVVRLKGVEPDSIDFVHGVRLLHALFRRETCDDQATGGVEAAPTQSHACPIDTEALPGPLSRDVFDLDTDGALRLFSQESRPPL